MNVATQKTGIGFYGPSKDEDDEELRRRVRERLGKDMENAEQKLPYQINRIEWEQVFDAGGSNPIDLKGRSAGRFTRTDVADVVAISNGSGDGEMPFVGIFRLKSGIFAFLSSAVRDQGASSRISVVDGALQKLFDIVPKETRLRLYQKVDSWKQQNGFGELEARMTPTEREEYEKKERAALEQAIREAEEAFE